MHLRWRHVGSNEWVVLDPAPRQNRGFVEASSYQIEKPAPGWSLLVDDEPLRDVADTSIRWRWEPGFFAGEVTAELLTPTRVRAEVFLLDVAPSPAKAGRDVFRGMIDELWNEDPAFVIGSEPATHQIGDLGAFEEPWLAFARLRRYAPDFIRAMSAVRARPRRTLRPRRDSTPVRQVRRVDRQTVAALVRSPAAALFADGIGGQPGVAAQHALLDVPVVEHTVDASANRTIFALTLAVRQRVRVVRERLQRTVEQEQDSETRTALAARWPIRRALLDALEEQLNGIVGSWPFSDVRRTEITAAGLTAIATDPSYARAWSRGWRALRHGVDARSDIERLWISPTWEIYERWCFVRLGGLLKTNHPEWGWRRHDSPHRWTGMLEGRRAELRLQPTYPSNARTNDGRWSVSKQRVPDIVFSIEKSDGTRFVVLDAKYRTSRTAVLDAMESAHIYHDSLRINDRRPSASLLLIPAAGGAAWLEAESFHQLHGVGVSLLTPEAATTIPLVMTTMLQQ